MQHLLSLTLLYRNGFVSRFLQFSKPKPALRGTLGLILHESLSLAVKCNVKSKSKPKQRSFRSLCWYYLNFCSIAHSHLQRLANIL